jgi:hypothetical protein
MRDNKRSWRRDHSHNHTRTHVHIYVRIINNNEIMK